MQNESGQNDPNDPVKISFVANEEYEDWIDEKLKTLKDYDSSFFVQQTATRGGILYQISTKHRNMRSEEYKRFMFQVKLKLGRDVKVR